MTPGPLRRTAGAVGLLALTPIALLLLTGEIGPTAAAQRSVVVLVLVVVAGRLTGSWLGSLVDRFEHEGAADGPVRADRTRGDDVPDGSA